MGSSSLLLIIGSTIVGGLLLLMLFRYNAVVVEKNHRYNTQSILEKNMFELNKLISDDFSKIGYCMDKSKSDIIKDPIVEATDSTLAFKTDVPVNKNNPFGDGNVDIVKYYLGDYVTETLNSRDKYLYRKVNSNVPLELNYGVTKLHFTYLNNKGDTLFTPISNLEDIKIVEYNITIEDIYGYNYKYSIDNSERLEGELYFSSLSKTKKISIKNLKNR